MRFILLVICLIASFNCNFVVVATCLLKNKKLVTIVSEGINLIKEKKFSELLLFALSNLNELKTITLTCLNDEPNLLIMKTNIPKKPLSSIRRAICSYCLGKPGYCKNLCHYK